MAANSIKWATGLDHNPFSLGATMRSVSPTGFERQNGVTLGFDGQALS